VSVERLYYFGCWDGPGHYLHAPGGREVRTAGPFSPPMLDDKFTLPGAVCLVHTLGWTILAIQDFTIDQRPGSNAAFLSFGCLTADEVWTLARQLFPAIVARLERAPWLREGRG
jgi:hypothetical protein